MSEPQDSVAAAMRERFPMLDPFKSFELAAVALGATADWLGHIDRLAEIDGALYPGLTKNPLWDAAMRLRESAGLIPTRQEDV